MRVVLYSRWCRFMISVVVSMMMKFVLLVIRLSVMNCVEFVNMVSDISVLC